MTSEAFPDRTAQIREIESRLAKHGVEAIWTRSGFVLDVPHPRGHDYFSIQEALDICNAPPRSAIANPMADGSVQWYLADSAYRNRPPVEQMEEELARIDRLIDPSHDCEFFRPSMLQRHALVDIGPKAPAIVSAYKSYILLLPGSTEKDLLDMAVNLATHADGLTDPRTKGITDRFSAASFAELYLKGQLSYFARLRRIACGSFGRAAHILAVGGSLSAIGVSRQLEYLLDN